MIRYLAIFAGSLVAGLLIASLARAQSHDHDAAAALALAAAQKAEKIPLPKSTYYSYADGLKAALADNRPLVTFVGCSPRSIAGAHSCGAYELAGVPPVCIIIGVPSLDKKRLDWIDTLPATATDAEIIATWQLTEPVRKAVAPVAVPFVEGQRQVAADDDLPDEVSSLLAGLERYTSARLTQVSGNRSGRGANWAVSRSSVPHKWSVPGGLDGLTGWTNQLYRGKANRVQNWLGRADPSDTYVVSGGELWGSEIVHQRKYLDGAEFVDRMKTAKGTFEVRKAIMKDGEWNRSVLFSDMSKAPEGYVRVSLAKCAECHDGGMANADAPGSGGYGGPRIPGGGGIFSESLAGIER